MSKWTPSYVRFIKPKPSFVRVSNFVPYSVKFGNVNDMLCEFGRFYAILFTFGKNSTPSYAYVAELMHSCVNVTNFTLYHIIWRTLRHIVYTCQNCTSSNNLTTFTFRQSWNLWAWTSWNSGPVQACNGIALPYSLYSRTDCHLHLNFVW